MKRGQISEAIEKWRKTITYTGTDDLSAGQAYKSLGKYFLENDNNDSAYLYLKTAVELAKKINNIDDRYEANNLLLSLFKKIKKQDSINYYLNICYDLKDSVSKKEKARQLQSLIINEQIRQQTIDEGKIKYRNTVIALIFFGIIIALILLTIFQFRNIKQKQKAKGKIEKAYSELKSTQAQLIQSEKMASLGELTAGIAHEIQNPLNFVNNFSEVNSELIDELNTELETGNTQQAIEIAKDIKENEQKINHHGKRADAIVKGMLQHSRKDTGQKEPTDINALADEYLRLSFHGMRAKDKSFNVEIKTEFDNGISKINIVPQDIGRVLLNLYNNAFYAVNEKSKIAGNNYQPGVTISTGHSLSPGESRGEVIVAVEDNGNGIPQNIVDKIFQPFFTTKPTGEGTGLGLSLAYDIITKGHNGTLKVESTEGEGSKFIIQLPILI